MDNKALDDLYLRTCSLQDLKEFLSHDFHTKSHHESFRCLIERLEKEDKEIERLKKERGYWKECLRDELVSEGYFDEDLQAMIVKYESRLKQVLKER